MGSILRISFIFLLASCSLSKNSKFENFNENIKAVSIKTFSRGFKDSIVLKNNSLEKFSFSEKKYKKSIESKQWTHLLEILQDNEIDPKMLGTIEVKSNGHFSDRKSSEILYIITDEDIYESKTYDSSNPPSEIKDLLEYIKSIKIK